MVYVWVLFVEVASDGRPEARQEKKRRSAGVEKSQLNMDDSNQAIDDESDVEKWV